MNINDSAHTQIASDGDEPGVLEDSSEEDNFMIEQL